MPGVIRITGSRGILLTGLAVVLLLGTGIWGWAASVTLSGALISTGTLEVGRSPQVIKHEAGGVVAAVAVEEGQEVRAGDHLLRFDDTTLRATLDARLARRMHLLARLDRLQAEAAGQDRLTFRNSEPQGDTLAQIQSGQRALFEAGLEALTVERRQVRVQQDMIRERISGLDAQLRALEVQRGLADEALSNQRSLQARGLSQASAILQLKREIASLDGRSGEIRAGVAEANEQIAGIALAQVQRETARQQQARAEARELEQVELELSAEIAELRRAIAATEVRAPIAGRVLGMRGLAALMVLQPAEPILTVVPTRAPTLVRTRIAPRDLDIVAVGQPVTLRLSALSQRPVPEVQGAVVRISADRLADERTGQEFYEVDVTVPLSDHSHGLSAASLVPGMPVEVFIQTVPRTPLSYLLEPVTQYFTRAFRES